MLAATLYLSGQNGILRGTVFDAGTGELLPGVAIQIDGTTIGTITDLDGKFNLSTNPGTYTIRISYVSYEPVLLNDIVIIEGEVTLLDNIGLDVANTEIAEAVITGRRIENTETALMTIKRKSPNLIDGISSAKLKKTGDSDAASAMKRVTGVSVSEGKYVYIRGLSDRYTKTTLNGVDIPGLDPDRNTLQMDIFPTNVVDNLIVYKNFSADLPADFTGGLIDIAIKDFPENKTSNITVSTGYNPNYNFNNNFLGYKGGKTDFLGFDDGTRAIPAKTNIPFFTDALINPDGKNGIRFKEILSNFNPTMGAKKQTSFLDYGFDASYGNQIVKDKVTLGLDFSLSYKSKYEFYEDAEYNNYGLNADKGISEMELREFQKGNFGVENVFLSGMAGFAIKTSKSKYRIKLLHLQNGESRAGIFDYTGADKGSIFNALQYNLDYSQRSVTNLLIDGKHYNNNSDWEIEWKISPTLSKLSDPDVRFLRYELEDNGSVKIGTEVGFPERIWRNLDEINLGNLINFKKGLTLFSRKADLKFGVSYIYKQRDYSILSYAINVRDIPLTGNPDEIFYPENLWPYNGDINRGTTYESRFVPTNPNQYNANNHNAAGYISACLPISSKINSIIGLRAEYFVQRYTGQDQLGVHKLDNDVVLENLDLFPSINIVYNIVPKMNIRASFSRTIARPSFKELSYAEIFDPITRRTFIGGLHRDANDLAGIEYWDGNLQSTYINNYDLRWELFMEGGQLISLSGFYKQFQNPIELVQYFVQEGSFQPRNVGDGTIYGAEAEFRISLKAISGQLQNFSITSNFTYLKSQVKYSNSEYQSRLENAREGEIVSKYRSMAGMAPYIINSGLSYQGTKGIWNNLEAGLYYNVQGQTLEYVGIADLPDIYTEPFQSLNFNSSKILGKKKKFKIGLKIENILNDSKESVFKSYQAENQYFQKLKIGTTYKFSLSYNIF